MGIEQNKIEQKKSLNEELTLKEVILIIKDWVTFFKSKLLKLLIVTFIGGFIGYVIAYYDKPIYKAVLTFAMEDDKGGGGSGLSGALGLASSFGIDLGNTGGGAFAAGNLAELMKSRLIVEKVLLEPIEIKGKKTTLIEYYIDINNLRKNWIKKTNFKNIQFLPNCNREKFTLQQDSVLKQIYSSLINKDNLSIMQKDKKVTIISIEVKSNDEIFSKIFCENLAKETSDFYIETKSKKAKLNVEVLQRQVDSVKFELNTAITGVATATDNVYNLNPAFNIRTTPSKKKQIDIQANTAILTNLVVQLELAKITLRKETPLIQLIDKPIFPLEKSKIRKSSSILIGGFLLGFLFSIYFIIIRIYKQIITSND